MKQTKEGDKMNKISQSNHVNDNDKISMIK